MSIHVSYLAEEIDGVAPGVRIIVPMEGTPQAQRGSFCALVDLQGVPSAEALVERVLSAMQRTYYSERGTQSQVITETVRKAQLMLSVETQRLTAPWKAGVICIGVMADRMALAGLGSAFALLTAEDNSVGVFPADRLASHSAGKNAKLELWPLHRQKIIGATSMIAGSGDWLDLVSVRTLAATTAYVDAGSCTDAAEGLREQAGRQDAPGVVLVIEPGALPPSAPPPTPPPSAGGDEPPAPPPAAAPAPMAKPASTSGLPTAVNASPPVVSAPNPAAAGDGDEAAPPLQFAANSTAIPPELPAPAAMHAEALPPSKTSSARLAAGAVAGVGRARSFLASMLPDRTAVAPAPLMAEAAMVSAPAYTSMPPPPPKVRPAAAPFTPPGPATGSRARMLIAGAVILLLLAPAIVATLYWRQGAEGRAEADTMLNLAEARYTSAAEALDQADMTVARAMLTEAETFARRAEEMNGRTARSDGLLTLIQQDRKTVERVSPLYGLTLPLITFDADVAPRQVLVMGQDIYLLDAGRNQIVTYRLASDGESLAEAAGQVVMQMGDTVDGVTVGAPIDLAWQPPVPGVDDKSSLLVLDNRNHIFRYNQQVDGASAVDFGDDAGWVRASQIETFLGWLYVVDEGGNQIYRYDIGRYDLAEPWFQPTTQVNLASLQAVHIDGDIWLLYTDGKVVRYRQGEQLPYSLDSSVALPADAADLWVGQDGDDAIYLADRLAERILVFDKESGAYLEQFQAAEGSPLRDLRSLFVDRVHSTQYLLTDSSLYQERLPR
ncbi:hypothetical protein [Caldilinea sp.]|uniref:hypothetical protein n=1 Tax=Caldilinea sp. TaxID=2293560 RepID=UPI002B704161|nr:hypothetical protein [Caldilinea sp.]HRA68331.1 hypothetical protein [Caldilinea sp.]